MTRRLIYEGPAQSASDDWGSFMLYIADDDLTSEQRQELDLLRGMAKVLSIKVEVDD